MAAVVFAVVVWLHATGTFPVHFPLFVLAICGTGLTSIPLVAGWPAARSERRFAWLLLGLDVVLVTAIVTTSGGPRSLFTFLYVLTVMEGCFLLSRLGGLVVAGLASLLYVGLVLGRTILPLANLLEPGETTALEVLSVFLNAGVLLVSAIVAGSMAERYQLAQ